MLSTFYVLEKLHLVFQTNMLWFGYYMYMYKFYVNAFEKKHHYVSRENKCFYEII